MMKKKKTNETPQDGWKGFCENISADAVSGFIVFLLALPLSIGIAKASDFPSIMGLVTAIIGGVVVSFFAGSKLTIKGPAAGLIVIITSAVTDFGGGETGWRLALGAIFVSALVQVIFGLLKLGKLVDLFPLSVINGMLAAIGIIIMLKQIPVLLNIDPILSKGKTPLQLIIHLPECLNNLDFIPTIIGLISLAIMLLWPKLKHPLFRKMPAALLVLIVAIPAELIMDFRFSEPAYALVHVGSLMDNLNVQIDFGGVAQTTVFIRYVIMFALIGSLESLLTVKAIDMMDPWGRKSNPDRDLLAIGIGNAISALFGGLPMISEVARSAANVNNGARTRWSNFFHGFFLLFFLLTAVQFIELIPNTALAAMLISVGIKLAHPREFIHIFKIGKEQLAIFLVTILFTLIDDLLVGIAAGIVLNLIFHLIHGAPFAALFRIPAEVSFNDSHYLVRLHSAAIFSNYIGLKNILEAIPQGMDVEVDFSNVAVVDHTVQENLRHFQSAYQDAGGQFRIVGLGVHVPLSNHRTATRKKKIV